MKTSTLSKAGTILVSASLVAGAGVAVASAAEQGDMQAPGQISVVDGGAREHVAAHAPVQGAFTFSQDELTPNKTIATVFKTAANALCSSMSRYAEGMAAPIRMGGDVPHAFTATIGEMTEEGAVSSIIGCACSSNQPGGGAIANAEVSGVPLASIAAKVGIR